MILIPTLPMLILFPEARAVESPVPQDESAPQFKPDAKKAKEAFRRGLEAEGKKDWTTAFLEFSDAVNFAPQDQTYLMHRELARSHRVQEKMDQAEKDAVSGRLVEAIQELRDARALDPTNPIVRERLIEMAALLPSPAEQIKKPPEPASPMHLQYLPGKKSFELNGDVEAAYEEVARQFGVEAAFDVDTPRQQIHVHVDSLDFLEVMNMLGEATETFWKPLTHRLFFVSPNTPQKRKDYEPSVVRTVQLSSSENSEDMTEMLRAVREISGITRTEIDTGSGTLTMRGSPRAISVATDLVDQLEQTPPEVILEIEVLQVDRDYARQLGITPPQTVQTFSLSTQQLAEAEQSVSGLVSVLQEIFGTPSSLSGLTNNQIASLLSSGQLSAGSLIPPLIAFGGGMTTFFSTLPGAAANFSTVLSLVRSGQRIILRAQDGKPATFFVGDRIPVSLAQYASSLSGEGTNIPGVSSGSFPTTTLTTGKGPEFVATGDLRDESRNDLIVANSTDDTLSVFLSNGDGTFQDAITPLPATGKDPVWIATGNFNSLATAANNDNFPDLAVANETDNTVSIFVGNGDGTFKPRVDLPTGLGPDAIATAIFHDKTNSNLDLAVANFNSNTISIFPGNGDGTFGTPTTLVTASGPSAITVGDFNGDGHQDIAVTNKNANTVSVFLGNGDGTFRARVDYPTGKAPVWVSTADFRGIGTLDLAVANNVDNTVSILLGNGNGTFTQQTTFAAGGGPTSIAVADYNSDGRLDLLVSDGNDNAVSLLLGFGDGTFGPNVELTVGSDPVSLVTADFNADGLPDAAVANFGSNTVTVILDSTSFSGSTVTSSGTPFPGVEYIDVGVKVKATPRVHPNEDVSIKLNLDISSVTSTSYNGIPVIANQSVDQTVRVRADQPSLLAGLREPQTTTGVNGTPGLADIPGAGALFSNQNLQNQDTELLILITPHIISQTPRSNQLIYAGRGEGEGASGASFERNFERSGRGFERSRQPEEGENPGPAQEEPQAEPGRPSRP
ncbi:MAG TPA: FG-GAP-like repeat-containing protein [Candidatus Acidoferrum sp.]|nr:FG-GAP-like repeat-containing protein [Candidatus Acidoferrum sp.]